MTRHVAVMNTAFRDGFQSCVGARVFWDSAGLEAAMRRGSPISRPVAVPGTRCPTCTAEKTPST